MSLYCSTGQLMESKQSCAAPSLWQQISCFRGFLCLGIARDLPLKVTFWLFSVLFLIGWWPGLEDYLILKNNVAFTIYILYKELKGLSGVLQKSEVLGRISHHWGIGKNFFELFRNLGGSVLSLTNVKGSDYRSSEVQLQATRKHCNVLLRSIF